MPRADRLYAVSVMDYGALDLLGKKAATLLAQFTDVVLIAFPHAGVTRLAPNIGNDASAPPPPRQRYRRGVRGVGSLSRAACPALSLYVTRGASGVKHDRTDVGSGSAACRHNRPPGSIPLNRPGFRSARMPCRPAVSQRRSRRALAARGQRGVIGEALDDGATV